MFKKLLRGLAGKIGVKGPVAEIAVQAIDGVAERAADTVTGGLASDVEDLVKKRKARRSK